MKPKTVLILAELAKKWPSAIVAREKIGEFSGGILSSRSMANLDSLGLGPERIKIGRKVAYPIDSLVVWISKRIKNSE